MLLKLIIGILLAVFLWSIIKWTWKSFLLLCLIAVVLFFVWKGALILIGGSFLFLFGLLGTLLLLVIGGFLFWK